MAEKIEEFKSVDRQSEAPEPAGTGSAHRGADKDAGESTYSASTKAEVMAKIMNDLQAGSLEHAIDVYSTALNNPAQNKRGADKTAGEPELHLSPTQVKPFHGAEDVRDIFSGEELSEELLSRATTVFEAAVNARIAIKAAELDEANATAIEEAIALVHEETKDNVAKFLNLVAEAWLEKNEVAVDHMIKVEMAEDFIRGLKTLFEDNYIEVEEDKVDVVAGLNERVEELEARLNDALKENLTLKDDLEEEELEDIVLEAAEGMTLQEKDKFLNLAENISYTDIPDFKRKVGELKESVFKATPNAKAAEPIVEHVELPEDTVEVPAEMQHIYDYLARSSQK